MTKMSVMSDAASFKCGKKSLELNETVVEFREKTV